MGQLAIPIALAVASAGVTAYNQRQTAKKQDRAALEGLKRQRGFEQESMRNIMDQVNRLEGSSPEEELASRSSLIRDHLRRKQANAVGILQATGGGDAVSQAVEDATGGTIDYGDFITNALAGVDAPLMQRQGEDFDRADVSSLVNFMRRNSAAEDALTRMQIAGIRPNLGLQMLAAGLQGASTGTAMAGFNSPGTMHQAGSGLSNLGGQTPQAFYSTVYGPPMQSTGQTIFGTPGKMGVFKHLGSG
jgi:hypothetical protein